MSVELPFHLKTLPPEALDVLRFFGTLDDPVAYADDVMDGVGLSDRLFGKTIRRLVTKGYVQMDPNQSYRLTEQGERSIEELAEYDASAPAKVEKPSRIEQKTWRRLVMAAPQNLLPDTPAEVYIGFNDADEGQELAETADMVVRFSVVNGEPQRPREAAFQLTDSADHTSFQVTAGAYKQVRLRVQAFQLGPNPDDIAISGGLYVDIDVASAPESVNSNLVAYGANVEITTILE